MGYMNHLTSQKGMDDKVYVDSCGLHANFIGSPPDQRMQLVAKQKGVLFDHQAKLFEPAFFETFQGIFGVTKDVVAHIRSLASTESEKAKVHLVTDFSQNYRGADIPDPYYLGAKGFEKTWEMIEESCFGIYEKFIVKSLVDS